MVPKKKALLFIAGIFGAALVLRLVLAYVLLPGSGHASDLNWYATWAMSVSTVGPGQFYEKTVVNYPPGYIYILWFVGSISQFIATLSHSNVRDVTLLLVKIPPILLDIGCGVVLYRIALEWSTAAETALSSGRRIRRH